MTRISFNESDASHLYEWILAIKQCNKDYKNGYCSYCEHLETRLRKFIGRNEARRIQRAVNKYPYCENKNVSN